MPVKVEPHIVEELREMGLTLWEAKHHKHEVLNEKTGKITLRENKNWVIVTLAGPGVDQAFGSGKTLREAIDAAVLHNFSDRVSGLKGALIRCEKAMWDCFTASMEHRFKHFPDDLDDDVPF